MFYISIAMCFIDLMLIRITILFCLYPVSVFIFFSKYINNLMYFILISKPILCNSFSGTFIYYINKKNRNKNRKTFYFEHIEYTIKHGETLEPKNCYMPHARFICWKLRQQLNGKVGRKTVGNRPILYEMQYFAAQSYKVAENCRALARYSIHLYMHIQ